MKATKERVRGFITENYLLGDTRRLGDQESLLDTGVIDSTAVMELVDWLQRTFAIRIDDEELVPANLDSLDRITAYVVRKAA